ncbi:hypothetical protein ACTXJG_08320 [Glutamicibacter arilaitensis]|uniref:hypothetical protein n=1 Tax=Glutamicibacter arilaitensis TaxID=256701 RepID=UPI003FD2981E
MDSIGAALAMKQQIEKMRSDEDAKKIEGNPEISAVAEKSSKQVSSKQTSAKEGDEITSRRWMVNLPFESYNQSDIEKKFGKYQAVIGQLEVGAEHGYKHWNLYLEHKRQIRFSTLKRAFPKGHFEKAKKTRAACVRYATKTETYAGVRVSLGKLDLEVKQGKRTDLDSYLEQISLEGMTPGQVILNDERASKYAHMLDRLQFEKDKQEWLNKFRDIEVHYIHGESRTGKTSAVYKTFGYDGCYRTISYDHPFDSYDGQDILILDEFRSSFAVSELLGYLEGYPVELEARRYKKIAKFTKVFIITNEPLANQYRKLKTEHPTSWEAFKNRLTSVSEMKLERDENDVPVEAFLVAEKGTPPALTHYLTGKPVSVLTRIEEVQKPSSSLLLTEIDELEDLDFDEELSELFD